MLITFIDGVTFLIGDIEWVELRARAGELRVGDAAGAGELRDESTAEAETWTGAGELRDGDVAGARDGAGELRDGDAAGA